MRQVNLCSDLICIGTTGTRRLGGTSLRIAAALEIGAYLDCLMLFNRTGMRLFLGDANHRQHIENRFAFNFQLPR
jgi:hypothetical protein